MVDERRASRLLKRRPTQLPAELQNLVDQWAARQPDKPKRSEAIRRLIEAGLARQTSGRGQAAKALRMAARELILWSIRMLRPNSALGGSAVSEGRNFARCAKPNSTKSPRIGAGADGRAVNAGAPRSAPKALQIREARMQSQKLIAEAIGTFWLTLAGCGSAVLAAAFPRSASASSACRWPSA